MQPLLAKLSQYLVQGLAGVRRTRCNRQR